MTIVLILSIVFFIGICLWRVSKDKTEKTTFRVGGILVAAGLGLSLFFPDWVSKMFGNIGQERSQYLSNTFLIVASIGANLIAASLFMGDKQQSNKLCQKCSQPVTNDEFPAIP